MSTALSLIEVTESALESLLKEGSGIIKWIAENIGFEADRSSGTETRTVLETRVEKLLEFTDTVFFWVELVDTLKNRYIKKFGDQRDSPEHPRAIRMWKSVASFIRMWIIKMLEVCYSYTLALSKIPDADTSGNPCEPVLVRAWSETELLIRCPKCELIDLHQYTKPPYIGYPLICKHTCKDSSEVRRYQAIFPYVIHELTTSEEQPIGYQIHPSGKYWVTVGEKFDNAYCELDCESLLFKMTERNKRLEEMIGKSTKLAFIENVDKTAELLAGINLSSDDPKPSSPTKSSTSPENDYVDAIRSLSDAIEKRFGYLYSFQQILEIYHEDKLSDSVTWKIVTSVRRGPGWGGKELIEDEWICWQPERGNRGTPRAKDLLHAKTKPSRGPRTASLVRRSKPYSDLVTFSGQFFEDGLEHRTDYIPSISSPFVCRSYKRERFPYPDESLRDWAMELSEVLEMRYNDHDMLSWSPPKTLDDIKKFECCHTEKKAIVWYLMVHGIWHPREKEGTMPKSKYQQNHILKFYCSQKPCEYCVQFLEKVTKRFSRFKLCIGWRNIAEEEKARRPTLMTQEERANIKYDYNYAAARRAREETSHSVSMTYINVCGLGVDINWSGPLLPQS
ncbi:hypothetical protein TWF718_007132 [Orbilia javanica]|uniref:Uncharacterized protein n=1 Tax=Orbilia javanica TaxID=47235 RepID=A0AAN8RI55_9PEZI